MFATLPVCGGRLRSVLADCTTVGFNCSTMTWQRICRCSQVTVVGRFAILANVSPDSRNLVNFESVWLQIFWFSHLEIFLMTFWKHLAPIFLVLRNVRHVYLHVFAYIFLCIFAIFKLADDLKINDIKWKCDSFESRSMILNTSYQIQCVCKMFKLIIWKYFQNVENLYTFW